MVDTASFSFITLRGKSSALHCGTI